MANWYLKTPAGEYLRLSYDGAKVKMVASLIPTRHEGTFCYAATWATKSAAERQIAKYSSEFPELQAVKED